MVGSGAAPSPYPFSGVAGWVPSSRAASQQLGDARGPVWAGGSPPQETPNTPISLQGWYPDLRQCCPQPSPSLTASCDTATPALSPRVTVPTPSRAPFTFFTDLILSGFQVPTPARSGGPRHSIAHPAQAQSLQQPGDTRREHTASQRERELSSPREGPDTPEGDEVPAGSPNAAGPMPRRGVGPLSRLLSAPPAPRCPPRAASSVTEPLSG